MEQTVKITLKWVYTPPDFFEEKIIDVLPDFDHVIENGEITVSMDLDQFTESTWIQKHLHNELLNFFKGALLISQKPFTLNIAGQEILYPDGKKENIIQAAASLHTMSSVKVDVVVRDPNGEVTADTKTERLDREIKLGILSAKYREMDPVVESILSSFEKSLNNPRTCLVHLYEIRDALASRFKNEANAERELGISKEWNNFGKLANNLPLNQGRHSGKHTGALRDATEGEIFEARKLAIVLIEAYFNYLEAHS